MTTLHDTYTRVINGAGQRNYRAQCRGCMWHGITTSDRQRAEQDAAEHAMVPVRGVTG